MANDGFLSKIRSKLRGFLNWEDKVGNVVAKVGDEIEETAENIGDEIEDTAQRVSGLVGFSLAWKILNSVLALVALGLAVYALVR
jgi:hypothetical protein